MTDKSNLSDRITSRRPTVSDEDPDAYEDCGAFGFLRGVRDRALMLDLRMKTGNHIAFSYSLLERVSFDPSDGLTLRFLGTSVSLKGRNFHLMQPSGVTLLDALLRHRVPWIIEVDALRSAAKSDTITTVTRIDVRDNP